MTKTDLTLNFIDSQTEEIKDSIGNTYNINSYINDIPELSNEDIFQKFIPSEDNIEFLEYYSDYFRKRFKAYKTYPFKILRKDRFIGMQKWQCRVIEINSETFMAIASNLTDLTKEDEIFEFFINDVSECDKELLKIGAIFYWSIGYLIKNGGTKYRSQIFKFKRLPRWSVTEIEDAFSEAIILQRELGIAETVNLTKK